MTPSTPTAAYLMPTRQLTDENLEELRRPFSPEAIKFRPAGGGAVLAYIDARVVIERLNKVVGSGWSTKYEILSTGKQIVCHLNIRGTTRSDVGTIGTGSNVDPIKTGYSDALKRAAVHFGVGVSVYALKQIKRSDLPKGALTQDGKYITPSGDTWLRRGYRKWLDTAGKSFGDDLSHGDIEGSVGDPEAAPTGPPTDDTEAVDTPHDYDEQMQELVALYDSLTPAQRKGFGKAKFTANLRDAAEYGKEGLNKLKAQLQERSK